MKRSKFTESQIALVLRQGEEGTPVGEICRKAGISEATYYNWRKKYGGLTVGDEAAASARGGERQAEEDRRRPVARQGDAAGRHSPKALKPARKRQLVDHARATRQVSIRRACRALPVDRSTYHYRSRRAGQAELTERIKEIAATRVRYGYRRIHVLRCREGWRVNPKRVYRLIGNRACNYATKRQNGGSPKRTWSGHYRSTNA